MKIICFVGFVLRPRRTLLRTHSQLGVGVTPDKAQGILDGLNSGHPGASKCPPSKSPVPLQNEDDKLHFGHCLRIVAGGNRERSYPARVIHRKLFSLAMSPGTGYGS